MPLFNQWQDNGRRFERDYAESTIARFQTLPLPGPAHIDLEREYVPVRGLAAALAGTQRLMLAGSAGSGKTTTLARLALAQARGLAAADARARVPVFIDAASYDTNTPLQFSGLPRGLDVGDALATRCPAGFFNQALAAGRLLVLIDDLDALPGPAADTLLKEFDKAQVVASGRKARPGLTEFALPPWRDSEVLELASRVHGKNASTFVSELKASRVPRALVLNSLTLALLVHLWQPGQPLPVRRGQLFDEYTESLLGSANDTAKMLEDLALGSMRGTPISSDHVSRGLGLLRAGSNRSAEFVHELWLAYFAARALRVQSGGIPPEALDDPRWEQTILFYAGLGGADRLVDDLVARGNYTLAIRAAAQAAQVSPERKEKAMRELVERGWGGDQDAIQALEELASPAAVEAFASRLKDKDASTRARAAQIIGELRLDRGIDLLLPLLRDPDAGVRAQVLGALAQSPSDRVVDPLLVVLRGDSRVGTVDTQLRAGAALALGQVGSDRAVPALLVDLQTGQPEVRAAAAAALKRISAPLMRKPLSGLLQSGDEESRRYAAEILAVFDNDPFVFPRTHNLNHKA